MATATAEKIVEKTYRMRRASSGGFQAGDLANVRATEAGHAAFVAENFCKPELYTGAIEHPAEVARLDFTPAIDFSSRVVLDLHNADIRAMFGWTDEQITVAIGEANMPAGSLQYQMDGLVGPVTGARRTWKSNGETYPIDRYRVTISRLFPNALPVKK